MVDTAARIPTKKTKTCIASKWVDRFKYLYWLLLRSLMPGGVLRWYMSDVESRDMLLSIEGNADFVGFVCALSTGGCCDTSSRHLTKDMR